MNNSMIMFLENLTEQANKMKTLEVQLGERSYPIFIGQDLLGKSEYLKPYIQGKKVMIVTNETVAPLYLDKVKAGLVDFQIENRDFTRW